MANLWEYLWAGSAVTLWLYHMNWVETDSSWNSRDFTATNETWVEDGLAGAMSSNWSTTTCRNAAQALSAGNTPYTILFRVKLNAEIGSWTWTLASLKPDATLQDTTYYLEYNYNAGTRRLNYQHYYNWPETYYTLTYNITLWTTNWYDIAMVYTGSAMTLYVNWVSVVTGWGTGTYWNNWPATYQSWLSFLHWYVLSAATSRANARWDEMIFENRAWTPVEIQKYYTYAKWRFGIV